MLHKIVETKKVEVARLKSATSMMNMFSTVKEIGLTRGFRDRLVTSQRPVSVIAEVKKASPSKGLIREHFHPLLIADAYRAARVEAMSILTDQQYFQGNLEYLRQIREVVPQPLLRKDFIIDEIQIVESRASGADCVLFIAAILDDAQLRHFAQVADSLGLDALIEVHDRNELERVFQATEPKLLGINNRDLRTFETNLATTEELIQSIPQGIPVVSESGLATRDDIEYVKRAGARSVLIGEHFMRQADVEQAVIDLLGPAEPVEQSV